MIYCLLKLVNYLVFVDTNGHICDYQASADLQKFAPGLPFLTPYKNQTHGQRQAHILKASETNVTHMCPLLKDSNFSADFHRGKKTNQVWIPSARLQNSAGSLA